MPIIYNSLPFGEDRKDQFEIIQDENPPSQIEIENSLPSSNFDFRQPLTETSDIDVNLVDLLKLSKLEVSKTGVEDFCIRRVLGQGSFGKVYLVSKNTGVDQGTFYAMKVLKKASLKVRDRLRTQMERDILSSIKHPFIVQLHYAFQNEGRLFLILTMVKGGDLFGRLSKEVMFTEEDAKFYLAEIAMAINHLHKCGIVYRDLKPENILLDNDGHLKITDFGLCKEAIFDEGKTYSFCGTIEYMAPEVIQRRGHGPAADWWSFGVLMYEMLTGTLPFQSTNRRETMALIINAKLAMPNFLSIGAQKLLRVFFKRIPENRLGYNSDLNELQNHTFFQDISFEKLFRKEIPAPFIPPVKTDEFYLKNCNSFLLGAESPTETDKRIFKGFSYVAPYAGRMATDTNNYVGDLKRKNVLTGYVPSKTTNIINDYTIFECVGKGSYSVVYRAVNKSNSQNYAIKVIDKQLRDPLEEVEIMLRFSEHPNICTMRDVYEDEEKVYLVLEFCKGKELLDKINNSKGFSEKEVAYYMEKIVKTVAYLHEQGVVHRDLQPSNILFVDESARPDSLRICDFGFSKQIRSDAGLLMTPCFTANFVAPEVLKLQGYDQSCDVWSLGVIMYSMLSLSTPFVNTNEESPDDILRRIGDGNLDLVSGVWTKVSQNAKDLISKMLCVDPTKRIPTIGILKHPWIENKDTLSTNKLINENRKFKSTMKAMFSALNRNNEPMMIGSIKNSAILQRRAEKKKKK